MAVKFSCISNRISTTSSQSQLNLKQEELVQDKMGEDKQYLRGTAIPAGKINGIFLKAYLNWCRNNDVEDSYDQDKIEVWKEALMMPLVKEGLRCENVEDLAILYAWVYTSRFAFGHKKRVPMSRELQNILDTISDKLKLHIADSEKTLISLLEFLDKHVSNLGGEVDYFGRGKLCHLLCQFYYHNSSLNLNALTKLCQADILSLAAPNGSDSEFYLASLIACKAEQLLPHSSHEEKKEFFQAFKTISGHMMRHYVIKKILEPFFELDTDKMCEQIGSIAQQLAKEHSIK